MNRLHRIPLFLFSLLLVQLLPAQDGATDEENLHAAIAELRAIVLSQQEEMRAQRMEIETLKRDVAKNSADSNEAEVPDTSNRAADTVAEYTRRKAIAKNSPLPPSALTGTIPGSGNVNSKFGIDLYGYIKLDAISTSQDVVTDTVPLFVRQSNGSNDDRQFNLTAKETRLGAKLKGPEYGAGKLSGLFEFDFYGDFADTSTRHAYEMRTRQLYLQYGNDDWSILAGKTWETYLTTFPKTLNFSYYNLMGQLGLRKTQFRLTKKYRFDEARELTLKAALAEPIGGLHGGDLDGDGVDDGAESDLPNFEYALTYATPVLTDKPAKFSISGFLGQETADTNGDGSDEDFDTYAVIGGLEFPLTETLMLKGSLWTGTNLDGAWGGINQGINKASSDTIDATGGWVQLSQQATEKLLITLGYSMDNPKDADLSANGRTENSSYLINALYSFTPSFILGFEYMHLQTGYKEAADEETDWLQTSLIYKF